MCRQKRVGRRENGLELIFTVAYSFFLFWTKFRNMSIYRQPVICIIETYYHIIIHELVLGFLTFFYFLDF